MSELAQPRIDAHLHSWLLGAGRYAWLTPERGALYADFPAAAAAQVLEAAGIGSAVLVQAEDSARDTEYMLGLASENSWVAGVVGWVPLESPDDAALALAGWLRHPVFCGVRQLIHVDADPTILGKPRVIETLRSVAAAGLAFDVPDAWPALLGPVAALADRLPELRIIVDHLGKPPLGAAGYEGWLAALRDAAARPNTYAKLSGLQGLGAEFTVDALRPAWDAALEAFGPARLAYGGDWPMTVPTGGYGTAWSVLGALIGELSIAEQAEILAGTATRMYRLGAAGERARPRAAE